MNTSSISVIIPVYNEIGVVEEFLEDIEKFRNKCEILFVDGGSTDGTDEKIKENFDLVYSKKKGRANQMNYGAEKTGGKILFFLHVDSLLEIDALEDIERAVEEGSKVGCFRISFNTSNLLMKICGFMSNLRVRLRNIAFGDQGIFIEREYFNSLGGYRGIPLMEDYQLSIDIKNDGEKIRLLDSKILSSDRRFRENGRLRTMARMQRLQWMYRRGKDVDEIANLY